VTALKKVFSVYQQLTSAKEKEFIRSFYRITGKRPVNLALYQQAMRHSSVAQVNAGGIKDSYERLEYLGDAILGMVVAELLFKKYPYKEEGFLTELRARIVSRESLNRLSRKIGLSPLIQYNQSRGPRNKSIHGDVLEALIGAFYLDHGFAATQKFVTKRLIQPHYDLDEIMNTPHNHKSKIIEWAQKENAELKFELLEEKDDDSDQFVVQVLLNGKPLSKGFGFNKKKAEQDAAMKSLASMHLTTDK
jgi:ribonuclease-3